MKLKVVRSLFIVAGLIIVYCMFFRVDYHHRTAADYERIVKKLHVDLPEVSELESSDNYDRGASRWDCLEYWVKFAGPLPQKTIKQLDRKTTRSWNKWYRDCRQSSVFYVYRSEIEWESDSYFYQCIIEDDLMEDNDSMYIEYYIDEDESLFNILKYLGLLLVWAIVYSITMIILKKVIKD